MNSLGLWGLPIPLGPRYTLGTPTLEKWRRTARGRTLDAAEKKEYGAAVIAAVRAKQRAEFKGFATAQGFSTKCPCASGVWASDAKTILASVRRQNREPTMTR